MLAAKLPSGFLKLYLTERLAIPILLKIDSFSLNRDAKLFFNSAILSELTTPIF